MKTNVLNSSSTISRLSFRKMAASCKRAETLHVYTVRYVSLSQDPRRRDNVICPKPGGGGGSRIANPMNSRWIHTYTERTRWAYIVFSFVIDLLILISKVKERVFVCERKLCYLFISSQIAFNTKLEYELIYTVGKGGVTMFTPSPRPNTNIYFMFSYIFHTIFYMAKPPRKLD